MLGDNRADKAKILGLNILSLLDLLDWHSLTQFLQEILNK